MAVVIGELEVSQNTQPEPAPTAAAPPNPAARSLPTPSDLRELTRFVFERARRLRAS